MKDISKEILSIAFGAPRDGSGIVYYKHDQLVEKIESLLHSALEEQKRKCNEEFRRVAEDELDLVYPSRLHEAILNAPFPEGIEINDGWVRTKDKLPENPKEVAVCARVRTSEGKEHEVISIASYYPNEWHVQYPAILEEVICWTHLPNRTKVK